MGYEVPDWTTPETKVIDFMTAHGAGTRTRPIRGIHFYAHMWGPRNGLFEYRGAAYRQQSMSDIIHSGEKTLWQVSHNYVDAAEEINPSLFRRLPDVGSATLGVMVQLGDLLIKQGQPRTLAAAVLGGFYIQASMVSRIASLPGPEVNRVLHYTMAVMTEQRLSPANRVDLLQRGAPLPEVQRLLDKGVPYSLAKDLYIGKWA